MNKTITIIITAVLVLAGYFIFFRNKGNKSEITSPDSTSLKPVPESHHEKPKLSRPFNIVVSTDLGRELIYQLARTRTNKPYTIIKPGINPLVYRPTKEDEKKMLEADLVLYMGLGMEPGLEALIKKVSKTVRCEAISNGIPEDMLIKSDKYKSGYDPHFWWNPRMWEKMILHVVHTLSELDPSFKFNYGSIFIRYAKSLSLLDRRYIKGWSGRISEDRRILITLNPAFTYFGDRYGYKTMSLFTPESPGKVKFAQRTKLAENIIKNKVPAIFPEVGFPLTEIELLQKEVKERGYDVKIAEPLFSYSLGKAGSENYFYARASKTQMNRIYYGLKTADAPEMPNR